MSALTALEKMDRASKSELKEVYPLIARQIMARTPIRGGICVDVGTGPGSLAIEVAKLGDFSVYAIDISCEMSELAMKNVREGSLPGKVFPVTGDIESLPFKDHSVDLVISRGSLFFWHDKVKAFKEAYRVLKPGGFGYIGGGLGSQGLKAEKSGDQNTDDAVKSDGVRKKLDVNDLRTVLKMSGITVYEVINDDSGLWAIIMKRGNDRQTFSRHGRLL